MLPPGNDDEQGFSQQLGRLDRPTKVCPTVVIADDQVFMLQTVMSVLEGVFNVVGIAEDGVRAVELVHELAPDIVILDISMPGMNGIEAALLLKNEGCPAKIVFLSAHEDRDFVDAALCAGAVAYVVKRRLATDLIPGLGKALTAP